MRHDPYGEGVLSKDIPTELRRLQLLENALDPLSIAAIEKLPLGSTPRCLDMASGAGSMSYWLADRYPGGSVVSADIDPRYLDRERAPNLTVRTFDIREEDFPRGSFDLIHARSVLKHLPEREEVLARFVDWLAPGGWLAIVDGYWFPSDDTAHPEWGGVLRAIVDQMNSQGGDMRWTRRLPGLIARLGLTDVSVRLTPSLAGWEGWGEQLHEWIRPTIRQTGPTLVRKGYVTAAEVERFLEAEDGPHMAEWFGVVASVVGHVP
ncbi:class I SAM-dependent methyltransferase [Streptosporangium canum]|uniref:class I SAM-dependent methyltransferase n=1 Tax=Streptosporangium canum TaxID=324952 RepID=UPI0037A75E8D